MRNYLVKLDHTEKAGIVNCSSVVIREDHVTFFGVPDETAPTGAKEMRVALWPGWMITEVHESKVITP